MADDFRATVLGQLLIFANGRSSPDRRYGLPYPVYGSNGIIGYANETNAGPDSIIIGRVGSYCGSLYLSKECCWVTDNAIRVNVREGNDARFMFYLLSTLGLNNWRAGSGQPLLNQQILSRIPAAVPDFAAQRTIASILGALDDKIDLNRRMNETLEALARALFKDWFVDFGPTRAKMEGREPYLAPDLWALFPDRLDDEGKPEGWSTPTVGEAFHLVMGQSPPGDTYNDHGEGLPFFQGRTDFGFRFPENRKFCTAPNRIAEPNDTLISVRAPVGDINVAWERCCIGRGVSALRHVSKSPSFTYYSAWSIQQDLQQYEHTGTVFGAINKKQFEALKTIGPDAKLVDAFDHLCGPIDQRIKNGVLESRTLAQTRDILLPKLMSGEIRVREANAISKELK